MYLGVCPNASVAVGSTAGLPDNRAWEQVSPVDKAGSDVWEGGAMAAFDGSRFLFRAQGPFAGAETSLGVDGLSYLARRTASGWKTISLMPPGGTLTVGSNGYQGFTSDLSTGVIAWNENELTGTVDPAAPFGLNLYMRGPDGGFALLNGSLNPVDENHGFIWGSEDFSKLAINSRQALTPDAPCTGSDDCAYEWDNGELRLASILPNGQPVKGAVGSLGYRNNYEHAMSDDGARLFFASPSTLTDTPNSLYARENGSATRLISASERTLPGGASGHAVKFQGAEAAHGNRVIFTTINSLVDADSDETNDLYLYDFTEPEGERLTLLSEDRNPDAPVGAKVEGGPEQGFHLRGGVVGASEDLRRVYFVAAHQIVPGESTAPGPKLYLWDDTGASPAVTYVGTLTPGSPGDFGDEFVWFAPHMGVSQEMRSARGSSDGRYLVFLSHSKLTEADNEGREQVYRYDAVTGVLDCLSCVADAFPAAGGIRLNKILYGTKPVNHPLRNVTEAGQVFFETSRGLVPQDSNGKFDVYEYDGGQLHLISAGTGEDHSFFLDATPSGSDVFFVTRDRLVGWDRDSLYDVYDARVNGGLPEPPLPPPPCEGDSCQPPPIVPGDPPIASASFEGPESSAATKRRRCRAGKVRRGGKCRKKSVRRHRARSRR